MRKFWLSLLSILFFWTSSGLAFAANPQWSTDTANGYPSAVVKSTTFDLVVKAKATGLGNLSLQWQIKPDTSNNPFFEVGCRNKSGQFPYGTNKLYLSSYGYNSSGVIDARNGSVALNYTLSATSLPSISCPTGHMPAVKNVDGRVVVSLSYVTGSPVLPDLPIALTLGK